MPARSSCSSKRRPEASVQLLVSKCALVVPIRLVDQLRAPCTTVADARTSGATARSPAICASMAVASAAVNDGTPDVRARPQALPGADLQQVAAQPGDLAAHRRRGALPQRDHRHHRTDADDDAQHGEERTQQVAPDRAQRQQQRVPQHQAASTTRRVSSDDAAVDEAHGAARIVRHVRLVRDHQHGDAALAVQRPTAAP